MPWSSICAISNYLFVSIINYSVVLDSEKRKSARETGCRNCLEDYACNLLQKRRKLPYFVEAIINLTI